MKLTVAKIDKILFSGSAESVQVPGSTGEMTILSHHMPLITTLKKGKVIVHPVDKTQEEFDIESGFLEVRKDETTILV